MTGWNKMLLALAVAGGFSLAAGGAGAFHPGETHSGDVPQGPDSTACENQGRQGIDEAISDGGMVHCDEDDDDDNGDGVG